MDTTGDEPRKMPQYFSGMKNENKEDFDFVKLIDFEHPEKNSFTAVSQMWIQGKVYYRRPDMLNQR